MLKGCLVTDGDETGDVGLRNPVLGTVELALDGSETIMPTQLGNQANPYILARPTVLCCP
jgi:hypothetical protein